MKDKLEKSFKLNENNIAYKNNNISITYKKLYEKILYYSNLLKRQGNDPVILYGDKNIYMIIGMISCIFANRTYIPIDYVTPIERVKKIAETTSSSLIISDYDGDCNLNIVSLDELEKYKDNSVKNIENDIIYTIFTSGSSGIPKGVPISNKNLVNFTNWISNLKPLDGYKNINVLNHASFSFDLSVADIYYSLCNGHTLTGLSVHNNDYNEIFDILKKDSINVMVMTPTFVKMCLINPEFNSINFPSIKCMYFCGETLDKTTVIKIFKTFPNMNIINAYGPTEATSAVSSVLVTKDMLREEDTIPIGDIRDSAVKIYIKNEEIILQGDSVFEGYINTKSNKVYKQEGINCYETGDLGYIKNNLLYYSGRKENLLKLNGYRIELDDIEENLSKIKGVKDCAVIASRNCNDEMRTIKAFVVLEDKYDESYVKHELSLLLPSYMIPKIIKKINKLPINKNGKIDRKKLVDL